MEQRRDDLTASQYDSVKDDAQQLRILAGAGTGKTRVLTHRIAHQSQSLRIEPEHALCLTFTKKAANELRTRLERLGLSTSVTAGTFHALAYAQIKTRWEDIGLNRPPSLLESRRSLLRTTFSNNLPMESRESICTEIDWATARRLNPETYPEAAKKAQRNPSESSTQVSEYLHLFIQEKKKRNLIDFDDILEYAIRYLADDSNYAATRHWKYRYIFVDEFQDVNPLQFALLRAWLGVDSSICVVGDPDQAIYSWNGADARYLQNFNDYFPNAKTVVLDDNFRSTPQIIAAASAVLGVGSSLATTRPDGPFPSVRAATDCKAEARNISEKINESRTYARNWSDQAVLVRTHAQIATLTETFVETGIPFTVSTRKSASTETQAATAVPSDNAVAITTFHASKGLEWPVVHVAGLEDGFVPSAYATSSHALDEERRLLYVAMTRAQDQIHCSWARERLFGKRKVTRQPSQFLKDMSHLLEKGISKDSNGASIREEIHSLRERVFPKRPFRDPDESIRFNLERWRGQMALAAGVGPQDVISDEALEELITHQPKTREQLNVVRHLNHFKADRYGDELIKILSDEISE